MASKKEVIAALTYLAADLGKEVTKEKVAVWHDQFQSISGKMLLEAARLLLSRKVYGNFPRCADMWEALKELSTPSGTDWASAWDLFVKLARKHSRYSLTNLREEYARRCPSGEKAMGTMMKEYFDLAERDLPTFRAQFRQKYEVLQERESSEVFRPGSSTALSRSLPMTSALIEGLAEKKKL